LITGEHGVDLPEHAALVDAPHHVGDVGRRQQRAAP
jgi:hypothetical protein